MIILSHLDDLNSHFVDTIDRYQQKSRVKIVLSASDPLNLDCSPFLWFQRIRSPLDEFPSSQADGVSLLPFQDEYRLHENNLFSLLWLAKEEKFPIMIHLDGIPKVDVERFLCSDAVDGISIILCLSDDWAIKDMQEVEKKANRSLLWDLTHSSLPFSVVKENVRGFVLPQPTRENIAYYSTPNMIHFSFALIRKG